MTVCALFLSSYIFLGTNLWIWTYQSPPSKTSYHQQINVILPFLSGKIKRGGLRRVVKLNEGQRWKERTGSSLCLWWKQKLRGRDQHVSVRETVENPNRQVARRERRDGAQRGFRCACFLPSMNKSGLIRLFLILSQWRVRASPQIQK